VSIVTHLECRVEREGTMIPDSIHRKGLWHVMDANEASTVSIESEMSKVDRN